MTYFCGLGPLYVIHGTNYINCIVAFKILLQDSDFPALTKQYECLSGNLQNVINI